jgi:hypothetical protein
MCKIVFRFITRIILKVAEAIYNTISSIFLWIKEFIYNHIDLDHYNKFFFLLKKYSKKLLYPSIYISLFLDVIYLSISNYVFHSYESIVFLFTFILVFIIIVLRGCLKGEPWREQHTGDN